MVINVTTNPTKILFGAIGVDEVLQNVAIILTTAVGSVPLDRTFGINANVIDSPISIAKARLTAEIYQAINKYEPRAKILEVGYDNSNEINGKLTPTVKIEVNLVK